MSIVLTEDRLNNLQKLFDQYNRDDVEKIENLRKINNLLDTRQKEYELIKEKLNYVLERVAVLEKQVQELQQGTNV